MEEGPGLFLLILLISLNAFFALSEFALISLKQPAARRLESSGGRRGRALAHLLHDSGRFLATIQVGVTLAGFLASAFAAHFLFRSASDFLVSCGFSFLSREVLDAVVLLFLTGVLTYVSLVFGELVPKQLAMRYAEPIALNVAEPILFFGRMTAPFVWFLNASVKVVLRLFGIRNAHTQEVTEEEILSLVDIGEEKGIIEAEEKQMIENVFELNDKTGGDVMTYRTEVVALDADSTGEEIEATLLESGFSRLPVYENEIDNVIGVLHFREYFTAKMRGGKLPELRTLIHPVYLAPKSIPASVLFQDMKSKKINMAVLLDEFGGTAGIVTMEDLLEEIVGSLYDEYDDIRDEIDAVGENEWRIDGAMRIDEVSRRTGIILPEEEFDTLGGLVFGMLNTVPIPGTRLELAEYGVTLVVESVDERRADKIRMTYAPLGPEEEEAQDVAD